MLADFRACYTPPLIELLDRQLAGVQVPELRTAMAHLLGRGKLFRPLLALATYQALTGLDPTPVLPWVAPLELVHTFTLIHDDLPCMGDAQLRRGMTTVHVAHGEALAVLAGDALLNLALDWLATGDAGSLAARANRAAPYAPTNLQRLALAGSVTRATHAVVEGQVLELLGEQRALSEREIRTMYRCKTRKMITMGSVMIRTAAANMGQLLP